MGNHTTVHVAQVADAATISNLSRYYIYDFSELMRWPCGENGIIAELGFESSWDNPNHYLYLLRVDGELAGFAMVIRLSADEDAPLYDIGQFFVLRKFRRQGVGRDAAFFLFDSFRGHWRVRQMLENTPAQRFWQTIISEYTGEDYTVANEYVESAKLEMIVQRFTNAACGEMHSQSVES